MDDPQVRNPHGVLQDEVIRLFHTQRPPIKGFFADLPPRKRHKYIIPPPPPDDSHGPEDRVWASETTALGSQRSLPMQTGQSPQIRGRHRNIAGQTPRAAGEVRPQFHPVETEEAREQRVRSVGVIGPPVGPPSAPLPLPVWRIAPSPGGILEPTRYYFATPGYDERRRKRRRISLLILLSLVLMCGTLGCATGVLVTVVRARRGQREMADGETAMRRLTEPALRLDRSWAMAGGLVGFPSIPDPNATARAEVNNGTLGNKHGTGDVPVKLGQVTEAVLQDNEVKKGDDATDAALKDGATRSAGAGTRRLRRRRGRKRGKSAHQRSA
ncbi:hypothetical protein MRX96_001552 [Rhipicephalus microplus]